MDELTAVKGAVDGLVSGALAPLIELLAKDVEFEVASGGDAPECRKYSGQQASNRQRRSQNRYSSVGVGRP